MATLNEMTFPQVQAAIEAAIGRNISTADRCEIVDFGDSARCDFFWEDGACSTWQHDSKSEAIEQAQRHGFHERNPLDAVREGK